MFFGLWDLMNPINYWIGVPAVLYVIGRDRGWYKGWREAKSADKS